jgi:hypothetical protein
MSDTLPACLGCGVVPKWSEDRPGFFRFACNCNGFTFEAVGATTRKERDQAMAVLRPQVETMYREEHAKALVMAGKLSAGSEVEQ